MPLGPGVYDHLCTYVREQADAKVAIVIVIDGTAGSGFSVIGLPPLVARLPGLLRRMAGEIEESVRDDALYAAAREASHASGFDWTDPRTGQTYPPPKK